MLPIFQSESKEMSLMQTQWATQLNPLIALPTSRPNFINNIILAPGDNTIDHKLGRKLQGWVVIRMMDGFVQLYDKQNTNQLSDKTLILNSSGTGMISLEVF